MCFEAISIAQLPVEGLVKVIADIFTEFVIEVAATQIKIFLIQRHIYLADHILNRAVNIHFRIL